MTMREWLKLYPWKLVLLIVLLGFGKHFCESLVDDFHDYLRSKLNSTDSGITALGWWYLLPNIIINVLAGILIDNFLRLSTAAVFFSVISLTGHIFLMVSIQYDHYWLAGASRVTFGIGCESLTIVQLVMCTKATNKDRIFGMFGILFCCSDVFVLCSRILNYIIKENCKDASENSFDNLIYILISGPLISFVSALILTRLAFPPMIDTSANQPPRKESFRKFTLLSLTVLFIALGNLPFTNVFSDILHWKFALRSMSVWSYINLFYVIKVVTYGGSVFLVDRIGGKYTWLLCGVITVFVSHLILIFINKEPWSPLVIRGIGYAVTLTIIWPLVSFIVPPSEHAIAFGLLRSFLNIGSALCTLIAKLIVDSRGLFLESIIRGIFLLLAYTTTFALWFLDKYITDIEHSP